MPEGLPAHVNTQHPWVNIQGVQSKGQESGAERRDKHYAAVRTHGDWGQHTATNSQVEVPGAASMEQNSSYSSESQFTEAALHACKTYCIKY